MLRRKWLGLGSAIFAMAIANSNLQAGWPEFWHSANVDRERNHVWPQPFRSMDASSVQAPFEIMKNNGWRLQNTITNCMFSESNTLTDAGSLQLHWIVTQAPVNRRAVFVMQSDSAEVTAARVEAVELAISQIIPNGPLPQIFITDVEPVPSPGQYQTAINRAMIRTTPNPRLPQFKGLNTPSNMSSSASSSGNTGKK